MKLHRMTTFGLAELRRVVRETGALPEPGVVSEYWTEVHPADIDVTPVAACVEAWKSGPLDDARHAADLHRCLRLPRRVAADRMVWPWLSAIAFPGYTARRWPAEDVPFNVRRIDRDIPQNAFGRLWWSAEIVRVDRPDQVAASIDLEGRADPYFLLRHLFAQGHIHQELTYRNEFTDRTKLVAILALIHHARVNAAELRELLRDANLLLSTVLLDVHEADAGTGPYAVDPAACREALELLSRTLGGRPDPTPAGTAASAGSASTPPARRGGLWRRMFGKE